MVLGVWEVRIPSNMTACWLSMRAKVNGNSLTRECIVAAECVLEAIWRFIVCASHLLTKDPNVKC